MSRRWSNWLMVGAAALLFLGGLATSATPGSADNNESPGAPSAFRALTTGTAHSCAIVNEGQVKCWGNNGTGRLGLGDTANRGDGAGEMGDNLPAVDLGTGRTATAISAGSAHTCAILDNGSVKCWGNNGSGRLGLGDTANRGDSAGEMGDALPAVDLGTGRTATAISADGTHTCALLDNATVKCWGNNASGQLGIGDTNARGDAGGEMGNALPTVSLGTARSARAIGVGVAYSCALLDNGTVKCWGIGSSGQLGQGDTTTRGDGANEMGHNLPPVDLGPGRAATALSVAGGHVCAVLDDAALKCWGSGNNGQLGQGATANLGDNAGEMGAALPSIALGTDRTVTGVTTGSNHSCAVLDNSTVKCWGSNSSGQLGQGNTTTRGDGANEMGNALATTSLGSGRIATAISAEGSHTCARLDNAAVKCWGENSAGELGRGDTNDRGDNAGEMGDNLAPIGLGARRSVVQLDLGATHACALVSGGLVKCWGENGFGQLGQGDTNDRGDNAGEMGDNLAPVALGSGRRATAISTGSDHSCALLDNATVKCWGNNASGPLGLGDTDRRGDNAGEMGDALPAVSLGTGRTAVAVSAGGEHTCALLDNATIKCWGSNNDGELGLGDTDRRGDNAGEMGDALPAVSLGTGRTAQAVFAGSRITCALLDNATTKCWGSNSGGRLGLGDTLARGDGPNEMGDNLAAVDLGTGRTASDIQGGLQSVCARLDNATVKCWGFNANGELGQGDSASRGDNPGEMGDALPPVSLGTGRTVASIGIGERAIHTCTVLDDSTVKCWGTNGNGQLGLGNTQNRGLSAAHMGDNLPTVPLGTGRSAVSVRTGNDLSCAVLDNAGVKCWGRNAAGQLGQGDTDPRGDQAGELGDALPMIDLGSEAPVGVGGQVTATVAGTPVPGAFVALLRTSDFAIAGGAVANSGGTYAAEVPPGSYFVYVIDPAGRHTSGFFGGPTVVNVAAVGLVDADPTLPRLRGKVTGTIRETPSATPIPGAWALALSANGAPEIAVEADGGGAYELDDLITGNHFIGWVDPTGNHAPRFSFNSANVPDANPVTVTAGGSTTRQGSLPTQTSTPGGAALTGTVTQTGTNAPLAGILVIAQHAADFRLARAETTDHNGAYSLDVAAGSYKLVFLDPTGAHAMEWHDNQPYFGLANAANVTAPAATNAALDRTTGTMTGTLTDADTGDPLAGAWAFAISATGTVTGAVTDPDGTYTITGLPPGTYRATFVDPVGGGAQEYFDNSPDYFGGTNINITAGTTTPNINAGLTGP